MKNILVFFGGISVERDVSVITGVLTLNSIDKTKYNPVPIYVDQTGAWYTGEKLSDLDEYKNLDIKNLERVVLFSGDNNLYVLKKNKLKQKFPISCAVNCMHGERGENGSLSGLLALSNIPLASPNVLPSAISMDKAVSKIVLSGLSIASLPFITVESATNIEKLKIPFSFPVIVKPNDGGSSIGIARAKNRSELQDAVCFALRYSRKVIIEPMLSGFTEINCAGYKNKNGNVIVSPCEKPVGSGEILSFSDKYVSGKREFPAKLEINVRNKIQEYTKTIYKSLGFTGTVRIDFFVVDGEVLVNEINSVPGSLAFYLFTDTLKEFSALLSELITVAESDFSKDQTLIKKFSSKILSFGGGKGSKKLR